MPLQIIRIAIAEDQLVFRQCILTILNEMNDEHFIFQIVLEATDGNELLAGLKTIDVPDVCTLDISMEGKNGYDTLKELKVLYPGLPVLIFSQHYSDFPVKEMLKAGAFGFIPKNIDGAELKEALITIYKTGVYHPKSILHLVQKARQEKAILTEKEMHHLKIFNSDKSYKEIGAILHVSDRTVQDYGDNLFDKLPLKKRCREALMIFAAKMGLIPYE